MSQGQPQYCSELVPNCPGGYYCHFGADRDSTVCCPARSPPAPTLAPSVSRK